MKTTLLLALLLGSCTLIAQHKHYPQDNKITCTSQNYGGYKRCVTMENDSLLRAQFPERGTLEMNEAWLQEKIEEHKQTYQGKSGNKLPILIIPVVVHVIHNGDAVGTGENIADGQVLSQIQVLNEDFRRMLGTPGHNTHPDGADVEIEFCMAQVDPLGNPTNGIDRVDMGQATWNSMAAIDGTLKPATQWDPTLYCNMWTVRFGGGMAGTLGYAQFPDASGLPGMPAVGGPANSDGVVSSFDVMGSQAIYPAGTYNPTYNLGRTMTHEVGHWLGLRHIWGDGGCGVDDFCTDTPESDASNFGCPTGHVSCGTTDMIENYMDYTDDACMNIFTNEQKTRIRTVLTVCPRRMELPNSTVCSSPTADDAGIQSIISPVGDYCNVNPFTPEVELRNYGNNNITSVDIIYNVDGGPNQTFNWTGTLTPGSTVNVTLPLMASTNGAHIFNAWTNLPNGVADGNAVNDASSSNFTLASGTAVTLTLTTDCWGYETYWELEDVVPTVLYSGGNTTGIPPGGGQGAGAGDPGSYGNQITITENWCLADGCYDFTIYDDWGDGLDGTGAGCPTDGNWIITEDLTATVLAQMAVPNFGNSETANFCIASPCTSDAGTMVTTPTLTLCGPGAQTATHNGDQTLDGNDAMQFVLHDNAGTTLGNILGFNNTPSFGFVGGMTYGTTYYISAVVGDDLGGGVVNPTDPCLSVAVGTPVIWYDLPLVSAGVDQTVCAGASVTLSGTGAVSYTWDNGVTDGVPFIPVATTTYTVTGTDGNGCQNTDQVIVTVNTLPTVSAGVDQTVCAGTAVTLSGSGAVSYTWDNGVTDGVPFTPAVTTTYTVNGTDGNGCQNTDQVIVTVNSLPAVSAGADQAVCPGTSVTLSGSGAVFYTWDNGVTDGVPFIPAATTTYTVTGTDGNGCQNTDQVIVTVNTLPTVSAGADQAVCTGNSVTLSGSGAVSYTWDNGVTDGVPFVPAATTTYTVTGTDGNGCQNTDQVIVTVNSLPNVSAGADQTVCSGDMVTLSGSGAVSYTWDNGVTDGVPFAAVATTTYTVTGTDGNGCQNTDQATVTVNALPTVSAGADQAVCPGTSVTLSGSGAVSYTWDNGVTDSVPFVPVATATYTVTGTDANGCQNTDQVIVTVNSLPAVSAGADQSVCNGDPVTLSGSGAVSYTWDNGVTDGVPFIPVATTTYTVTGTDGNGCQNTDQVIVTVNSAPTYGNLLTVCNGAMTNYTVSFDVAGGLAPYNVAGGPGSWAGSTWTSNAIPSGTPYSYTVTDQNGCSVGPIAGVENCSCVTNSGTMVTNPSLTLCGPGAQTATHNGDQSFDGNDAMQFYIHDNAGTILGTTFGSSSTPTFSFGGGMIYGTTYYISAVVGNDLGGGIVDLADPCLSVSVGTPVIWYDLPTVSAGADQAVCAGTAVTLSGSGAVSYTWDNGVTDGVPFVPAATTTYAVTGTDGNGCQNTDQAIVTVNALPAVSAGADQAVCTGNSVTLSGSGAVSYTWDNGVTDAVPFISTGTTTYTVTGTDGNGCQNTDQATVTVNALPTVSAGADQAVCTGTAVTLSGSGAVSYTWDNGVTDGVQFVPAATTTYTVTGTDGNGCQNTDQAIVTVNALPTVSAGADQAVCAGTAVTLSGSGAVSYTWDNGVTDGVPFVPAATSTYTVTGIDGNGCQNTDQAIVTVNALPTVSAGADQAVCTGISVTLSGSGAVSYTWDNGVTDGVPFTPAVSTTLTVTGTDGNGCQNTDQVLVTVNGLPTINAGADQAICDGDPVTLTGSGAVSYSWDNGVTDGVAFNPSATTTYTLIGTDGNGCQNTDQVIVTVNPLPTFTVSGIDPTTCGGTDGELVITGLNNNINYDVTYTNGGTVGPNTLMSDGTGQITIGSLGVGNYTNVVVDLNGCGTTDLGPITLSDPGALSFTSNLTDEFCTASDGSIVINDTGGQGPVSYSIDNGTNFQVGNTFNGLAAGVYDVLIMDSLNCQATGLVTIVDNPAPLIDSINTTAVLCYGDANGSIEIFATGGTTLDYSINGGTTTQASGLFTGLSAGTYNILVTDQNGCTVAALDSVTSPDSLMMTANLMSESCGSSDGFIELTPNGGVGPYTYDWSHDPGNDTSAYYNLGAGPYLVQLSDANGCSVFETHVVGGSTTIGMTVITTDESCSGEADGQVEIFQIAGGIPPYTISWDNGDTGMITSGLTAGDYTVTITDSIGCATAGTFTVGSDGDCASSVNIHNAISPNNDGDNDTWVIENIDQYPDATVEIFNRWGSSVFVSTNYQNDWDGTHKGKDLPAGVYFYVVVISPDEYYEGAITIMR